MSFSELFKSLDSLQAAVEGTKPRKRIARKIAPRKKRAAKVSRNQGILPDAEFDEVFIPQFFSRIRVFCSNKQAATIRRFTPKGTTLRNCFFDFKTNLLQARILHNDARVPGNYVEQAIAIDRKGNIILNTQRVL